MNNYTESTSHILVVDDEEQICRLFCTVLEKKYTVDSAPGYRHAEELISHNSYDLIITDLKLPDGSGIDVLRYAKEKDPFCEVIIITAFASLDSATEALNLGASSYLLKPIAIESLNAHVDKAVANRDFYLKSQMLKNHYHALSQSQMEHLTNMTHIYELFRKLLRSLDIRDIMNIILENLNTKMRSVFCMVGVNMFGFPEVFAMSNTTFQISKENIKKEIIKQWGHLFQTIDQEKFQWPKTTFNTIGSNSSQEEQVHDLTPIVVPVLFMGGSKGCIATFLPTGSELSDEKQQYLHVFSSLISPLIENAYTLRHTKNLAATDPLTGVSNHRSFHEMLTKEIARANRDQSEFGLIMLDIDDFKAINDTYGHQVGDAVLQDLCSRILGTIRGEDLLSRYGGEEFTIIVTGSPIEGSYALAERIRVDIDQNPITLNGHTIHYTISVGLTIYNGKTEGTKESLIKDADDALYTSKKEGKNRVSIK